MLKPKTLFSLCLLSCISLYSYPTKWLQEYIKIPTFSPTGEEKAFLYIASLLEQNGIKYQFITYKGRTVALFSKLEKDSSLPTLILMHHLDVVPAEGKRWKYPPFSGVLKEGKIWGRGAIDAKGLGIAQLLAFIKISKNREKLNRNVAMLVVCCEEKGGTEGVGWLIRNRKDIFLNSWVINEGGIAKRFTNGVGWWGIEVVQKKPLWIKISARGRGGHSASGYLDNPLHKLLVVLNGILELKFEPRITEAGKLFLKRVKPLEPVGIAKIIAKVLEKKTFDTLFPGMQSFLYDTLQITMVSGSQSINIVPEKAEAYIDMRLLPDTDIEGVLKSIKEKATQKNLEVEILLQNRYSPISSLDSIGFKTLEKVLSKEAPVVPFFLPGFTDARFLREAGIDVYGISPFVLDPLSTSGIHGANESISEKEFIKGVRRMEAIVKEWAF